MTATKLLLTASPVRAVTPGAEHRRTIRHVVAASHRLLRQRIDGVRRADVGLRDLEGLFQALRRFVFCQRLQLHQALGVWRQAWIGRDLCGKVSES
jgi:hypothetical protein